MFHVATLAFEDWDYCPPLTTEANDAPHFWHHAVEHVFVAAFPLIIGDRTLNKSIRVLGELARAGTSSEGGVIWGEQGQHSLEAPSSSSTVRCGGELFGGVESEL